MSVRDAPGEMTEEPPNTDGPVRNFLTVGEPMQAYREVAQAVIASAVTDLVKGRARAEEAYQFLCGASDDNRAMLEFWCFVAGYSPALVVSTTRARSMCAWRVWWLDQGKHRLQQIQDRLEQMRPRFVSVRACIEPMVTDEERDGWPPALSREVSIANPEHLAILK